MREYAKTYELTHLSDVVFVDTADARGNRFNWETELTNSALDLGNEEIGEIQSLGAETVRRPVK